MIFVTLYFRLRVEESPVVFEDLRERAGREAADHRDLTAGPSVTTPC